MTTYDHKLLSIYVNPTINTDSLLRSPISIPSVIFHCFISHSIDRLTIKITLLSGPDVGHIFCNIIRQTDIQTDRQTDIPTFYSTYTIT